MNKVKEDYTAEDFEIKAREFISLTFDLCEQELSRIRPQRALSTISKRKALQFSALSVLNSIKAFRAIIEIESE